MVFSEKKFGENTVAETSFDWNLVFLRKKKQYYLLDDNSLGKSYHSVTTFFKFAPFLKLL